MKLGILCSGNLGFSCLKKLILTNEIKFVFTDGQSKSIHEFCVKNKITLFSGNPRNGLATNFINNNNLNNKIVDVVISINYLFLIDEDLINLAREITFNVHGSLLPKYRGRTPHVWSIINNEKFTGITAHLVDTGCDTGDLIDQIMIEIDDNDTGATLLDKYSEAYLPLINRVLDKVENKGLITAKQDHSKASYFGKRTPVDGLIDWNWQKERIRNWVRAQAAPYPGAYTYLLGDKLIIDKISYSNYGFSSLQENGTVLSIAPLVIKTPNGAIEIIINRGYNKELLKKDIILGHDYR